MHKYITALALLVGTVLLTITTALAQVPTNNGNVNIAEHPAVVLANANWRMNVGAAPLTGNRGNDSAQLTLESNALVCRRTVMTTTGDDMGPQVSDIWSIPLSGAAKEVVFTAEGNLVVYDTANKVLWQSNTAGRGHLLRLYGDGVLDIDDKAGRVIWNRK